MKKIIKLRNDILIILVVLGIIGIISVVAYAVSLVFNPLFLLLILPAWILYSMIEQNMKRRYNLKRYGYFGGGFEKGACKYEEYNMGKLREFKLKLENTAPGHWELFVLTESEWRSIVPDWAMNRRIEIIERIIPYFKSTDVHFSDDF